MGYEIDFLQVGESNGDAICVRYGDEYNGYTVHVVDGGYTDTGQIIINHLDAYYGAPNYIDHVILSHADQDHAAGLVSVLEHYHVGALWMNRPWLYAVEIISYFHGNYTVSGLEKVIRDAYPIPANLEDIAIAKNIPIYEVFAGYEIGAFTVLAPTRERYLELIPELDRTPASYSAPSKGLLKRAFDAAKKTLQWVEDWNIEQLSENPPPVSASNETSVVQFGEIDGSKLLLTADAGPKALHEAAAVANHLGKLTSPTFVQVPHHGGRRNVTPKVLNTWLGYPVENGVERGTAYCSVGSKQSHYPRHRVKNAFIRCGYNVASTRQEWTRYYKNMPVRPGGSPLTYETFSYHYEE